MEETEEGKKHSSKIQVPMQVMCVCVCVCVCVCTLEGERVCV